VVLSFSWCVLGGSWCFLAGFWLFVVVISGYEWILMTFCSSRWFFGVFGWFLVVIGSFFCGSL
jgi:hypothetical protein